MDLAPIPLGSSPPLRVIRNAAEMPPRQMPGRPPLLDLGEGPARVVHAGSNPAVRVDTDTGSWRLKSPGTSWESAMEVTMAKLFRLTGLAAPQTGLADEDMATLPSNAWQVASRYEDSFQDLGAFLASEEAATLASGDDEARRVAYAAQRARHDAGVAACEDILQRAGVQHFWQLDRPDLVEEHAAQDRNRFEALEAMNRMLPANVRCEQLRHYIASSWLANWDHLNYRMENFGYAQRDGHPVGMTVDFGSCGPLGFRDLRQGRMLPKAVSQDIALLQRPRSLFPIPEKVCENAADFDALGTDPGMLLDTLRRPYGFQSETVVEMIRPPTAPDVDIVDTLSEMGYRLKLLSVGAIAAVVQCYWQTPAEETDGRWPSADALVDVLRARRDAMLQGFDEAQLAAWARDNPDQALRVQQEMLTALQEVEAGSPPVAMAALQAAIHGSHDALLSPPEAATAANGLTREIRSLQAFRNAVKELAAGRQDADNARMDAAVKELLSDGVHGQLMINLHLGPGHRTETRAAFTANLEWLQLMTALVAEGSADASSVADVLTARCGQDYYPPAVAFRADAHPEICSAFIDLLGALSQASPAVDPADLRSRILQAKNKGQPNFYTTLLGSHNGTEWNDRLARHALLPGRREVQQIKGQRAALSWRGRETTMADGSRHLVAPPASPGLDVLLPQVERHYGPRQLVKWEEALLREHVFAKAPLASGKELQSVNTMVADAAADAWRKALQRYPILKGTPLPKDMVETLQAEARKDYRESMQALRGDRARQIIAAGYSRHEEDVLADPGMSAEQRRTAFDACVEATCIDIRAMVEGKEGNAPDERALADVAGRVTLRANALKVRSEQEAARETQAQAAEQAREHARKQASLRASGAATDHAGRDAARRAGMLAQERAEHAASQSARRAAAEQAERNATLDAQRVAGLRAHQEANTAARTSALRRAEQEARERAVRVSDAKTERIAQRLQALKKERGEDRDREIERRLAALRAPDSPAPARAPAARVAEYLDGNGRPRATHR